MSLLASRQAMAEKLRLRSLLREALATRGDVQALFVGATTLDDVFSLLIELHRRCAAGGPAPDGAPAGELQVILLRAIEHCRAQLERDLNLSQPELLALSIAELVSADTPSDEPRSPELAARCAAVRAQLRRRRRAGMNMGRD